MAEALWRLAPRLCCVHKQIMRIALLFLSMTATRALANTGTAIPEPSDIGLFVLAVAGLILGHSISKRPPADPDA